MEKDLPLLHITDPDGKVHDHILTDEEVTIGRGDNNVLVFFDPKVSRNHAKIEKRGNTYVVTDLGSFNGTRVNQKFIKSMELKNGDEIRVGKACMVFRSRMDEPSSKDDTLTFSKEDEYKEWQHQTIAISNQDCTQIDSRTLLITPKTRPRPKDRSAAMFPRKDRQQALDQIELSRLERMNKVLFVLYEISRHINIIHDFKELLEKIMDLIFMVIDADYGFLILLDEQSEENFVPVVEKFKDDRKKGTLRASRTLCKKVVSDRVALLTSNAMDDARFSPTESLVRHSIRSAMCVPLWQKEKIIGTIQLDSSRLGNLFTQDDLELLKAIGCQMSMVLEQANLNKKIREEEKMRSRLERYHSPQVIDMILKSAKGSMDDLLEAKDVSVTILFTDIVGFTKLSERLNPLDVNMLLNQYFSRMTDIIFEYEGTLDKYVGDRLMAVFGAPVEKDDDAERAIRAALRMRQGLAEMMQNESPDRKFDVRLGINTGHVVAGNIGSPKRMDYTVIGDSVNVASRLESSAEPNQILIGEETYRNVKDKFKIQKVGSKTLRGKTESVMVYEVLD
jgi:adenylate cyclase